MVEKCHKLTKRSESSKKSSTMEELGPYDTIKPSRMRKAASGTYKSNNNEPVKRNSNNNMSTNKNDRAERIVHGLKRYGSSDKLLLRAQQPPPIPPKPASSKSLKAMKSEPSTPPKVTLERSDSFEGHEEAVRTLVEAVHESRKFEASLAAQQKAFPGQPEEGSSTQNNNNNGHGNVS